MHKTIIADTSCFIILSKIEELDLLKKVYGQIVTTFDGSNIFSERYRGISFRAHKHEEI